MAHSILPTELVFLDVATVNKQKNDVLQLIAKEIAAKTNLSAAQINQGLLAREALSTTGFGSGFAIPHTKSNINEGIVAFFRFTDEVEWQSLDEKPVKNAITLIMPEKDNDNMHLKMIAKLARLLVHDDFIDELNQCQSKQSVSDLLALKLKDM
ncbi:PTS sugar transporter subunit IIA [Orbus sturtevantii]|uniref:PTS sugar transporter subunit IIA n=1 Tax=Orbus sturtevantii TaxID=3074109 RepID=UPI00370DB54C